MASAASESARPTSEQPDAISATRRGEASATAPMRRNRTADVLRGLAIVMVVFGHSVLRFGSGQAAQSPLFLALAALEMPLFAFVSGYVVFGRVGSPRSRWLGRKASQLLVPFFVWWALWWLLAGLPTAVLGLDSVSRSGFVTHMWRVVYEPRIGLWYLWVLFGCYLVLSALLPALRLGRAAVVVGGAVLVEAVFVSVHLTGAEGSFGIPMILEYWPFFIVGYFMSESGRRLGYRRLWYAWTLLVIPLLYVAVTTVLHSRGYVTGSGAAVVFANLAIRWFVGFLGIAFAVAFVQVMPLGVARRWLSVLGRISIGIYATHFLFLNTGFGDGTLRVLSSFAVSLMLSIVLTLVLRRIPVVRGLLLGIWSVGSRGAVIALDDSAYATGES